MLTENNNYHFVNGTCKFTFDAMTQEIYLQDLGTMSYKHAWDLQETLLQQNVLLKSAEATRNNTTHHLLFVEHPPVYTLGKNGNKTNLLIKEELH